jgi:outer membrane protein OmpA-like peptidoglycan-associated protein
VTEILAHPVGLRSCAIIVDVKPLPMLLLLVAVPAWADTTTPPDQGSPATPEPDRDRDGIPDRLDRCPDEPEAATGRPHGDGCPDGARIWPKVPERLPPHAFNFARNKSTLPPTLFPLLDENVSVLRQRPDLTRIDVIGHTDDKERAGLGRARAEAIVAALRVRGIDAARLTVKDAGARQPLVANKAEADRARNRRVELVVVESR